MLVTNVGKISGQLLKSNLTRTSDLLFDNTQVTATPTLFIGHTNNRIGIKTDSPTRELLVNGDTKITGDSIQTNSMTVGNLTFNGVTSTVTASVGSINLNSSGSHTMNELRTDNLAFTNSGIRSLNGSDIKIYPGPGTGKFIIPTDLKSYGGIHATGDITFDGSVFLGGDGPEDSLTVGADIDSNLIPDATSTYDLGETGKRWGQVHLGSMTGLTDVTVDNTISLAGVRVNLGIQNKWYVSTNGADNLAGNHPNFAFGSIKHALNYIQESSGGPHQLHILPGTYIEEFPLEVPENVSVKGSGIRSCIIKPSVPGRFNDAFVMNNASMVADLTIQDFQYDSAQDKGYAFRFSTNAGIVSKSPYIQNVTVITQGTPPTVTASSTFGVDAQENNPRGITFNNDGTKMFIVGAQGDDVNEYTLSVGFDLSSTVTFIDSFPVTQCPNPTAVKFNADGTKMFVTGTGNNNVHQYTLSTGFDVSTAGFTQTLVTTVDSDNFGLDFNNDGTKMYITGNSTDSIYEFNLSSAFDISTATLNQSVYLNPIDDEPFGIEFNTDGTRMLIVGTKGNGVDEFKLTTAFDISTATHMGFYFVGNNPSGIHISPDGTKMFIIGNQSDLVKSYDLGTSYRVSQDNDPRGFDSGDAGKGALLDANVLDSASPRASMLFNGVTFITPGVDAVTVKNGSRIEFIDCFTYFANRGLYMQHSLNQYTPSAGSYNPVTGDMTLTVGNHSMRVGESVTIADNSLTFTCAQDNHQTDHTYPRATDPYSGKKVIITATTATGFTCNVGVSSNVTAHLFKSATSNAVSEGTLNEARVIASATIYGNKGVVADGNGCLAYLISHNFAYVGTGKNVENETDIINQENEVITTNNAKVHFVSQDQDGDFRVGENFIVDLGKGTTSIDVTGLDLTGSTLTVGTPGSTTLISATGIDVPNFRISNNTISTLQNGLTIDSAGTTNINANAQMNQNVTVSGDATIAGSGINFGDAPGDTINFSMDFTDNLLPSSNTLSNLGSANKQWRTANFERAEIDGIQIKDSTLQTTDTNAGIDLRGSGTGSVNLEELRFKTEITSTPANDVGFGVGAGSLQFTGLQDIQLPKGSTAQRPVAENSVRYNTDVNEFEVQSTGNIPLGGIRDGDLDTKVDLSNNEFTFFSAGSNMGTIDGLGNLTVPRFASQDKFTIDGNQITVSTPGEEAALVANGNAKVFMDTSNFEFKGSELLNTGTNSDMVFTGTGTKQNRIIHFETTQAYKGHAGDEATRDAQTARQGELWWNTTNSTLEVYTGSQWKSATGLQEITVTEAFAQELNILYNLILN